MSETLPMLEECRSKAVCAAIEQLPAAYMELDGQGTVCYANSAAREMHDPSLGELIGQSAWELMPPGEREPSRLAFEEVLRTRLEPPTVRRSIYTKQGEYRTYEVHRRLILNHCHNPVGMRIVSFDVTEAEQARKTAIQSRWWFESVLESLSEAVVVIDALGYVQYLNCAGEALTGWRSDELAGTPIEQGLPLVSFASQDKSELNFGVAIEQRWSGQAVLLDRSGREFSVQLSTSPIVDRERGCTTGVVAVMHRIGSATESAGPEPNCGCGSAAIE